MEFRGDNDSSDKDENMKRKFDSFVETEKSSEKKEKKPEKRKKIPLFLSEQPPEDKKEHSPKTTLPIVETQKPEKERDANKAELAPPEELEKDERAEAASTYVSAVEQDARNELENAIPESLEEAESAASVLFLSELNNRIGEIGDINDEILEDVVSTTAQELDIEPIADSTLEDVDEIIDEDSNEIEQNIETDSEVVEDDEEKTTTAPPPTNQTNNTPASAPPPRVPPTGPSSAGGAQPPLPPIPPTTLGGGAAAGGAPPLGSNINFNPIPLNPNAIPVASPNINQLNNVMDRRQRSRDLLLGGIVGYMIGRRRGRIKTEKRLLPVQEKLEKEVKDLQQSIASKEMEVRALAAKQFETTGQHSQKQAEKIQVLKNENTRKKTEETKPVVERPTKSEEIVIPKPKPEVNAPAEIEQEKDKQSRVESNRQDVHQEKETIENKEKKLSPKAVAQLSLPMLLSMAETIQVENRSLRSLYDNGELSRQELRESVKAYVAGEKIILPERLEILTYNPEKGYEKKYDTQQHHTDGENDTIATVDTLSLPDNSANKPDVIDREKMSPDVSALFENPYKTKNKSIINKTVISAAIVGIVIIIAVILLK